MANVKQIKSDTLATIDAAMSIVNKFPKLWEANTELSFNTSTNPFELLMDLLKSTEGYNNIINILSKYIAYSIPVLEASVKTILITKLKDIISCSVNPFFTEEILRDGIVLNIEEIDIADTLKYSPFDDEVGKFFYFGLENVILPDDLTKCDDMDAFIWFMINKANRRYTWKPMLNRKDEEFRSDYPTDTNTKLRKEDGIITFEYYEDPINMKNAYGDDYRMQTPFGNNLHVFIGDVREQDIPQMRNLRTTEVKIFKQDEDIKIITNQIEYKEYMIAQYKDECLFLEEKLANDDITEEEYKEKYRQLNNKIRLNEIELEELEHLKELAYGVKHRLQHELGLIKRELETVQNRYFPFLNGNNNRNYYYGKSLIEFNIDYILSLKLFDEKVLSARLLDALTGVLTIDLNLTYKQQLIKNEVKKMVNMINETDDVVVSDCFFTFSNKEYDDMSRIAELRKAGLLTINGDETSAVKINTEKILSDLNEINKSSSKETIQTIIQGTLIELSKELSSTTYKTKRDVNFDVQMNFIENFLNTLSYVIVCSVLSPKVYLLLMINLKIIGRETKFDLEGFIGQYKQLISDLIRSIRDQLLDFLLKEVMIIIGDLAKRVALKLSVEQATYNARLMKQLIDCFRIHSETLDFTIDNVQYADILPTEEEPKNNEC